MRDRQNDSSLWGVKMPPATAEMDVRRDRRGKGQAVTGILRTERK
jgi:hypothetical protein